MREILFRGKVKTASKTGQYELDYVHGNLIKELETGRTFIADLEHFDTNTKLNEILIEVIPETIGQYTGLKDKNGKKIFEGDMIEEGCNGLISSVVYDNEIGTYKLKGLGDYYIKDAPIEWEVIGTIFDKEGNDGED